jgi:Protein of unknown function (DUF1433).
MLAYEVNLKYSKSEDFESTCVGSLSIPLKKEANTTMQTKIKLIIILGLIFVTIFAIGGYSWMKHENEVKIENEKKAFIDKQEQRITKYFKYNVTSFKEINFTENKQVPTGDFFIHGYINNNKSLDFSAQISLGSGQKNFEADGIYSEKLDKLFRKDEKTVSQIEKIEKEQKDKILESK